MPCDPSTRSGSAITNEFSFYSFDNGASTKPYESAPPAISCTSVGPTGVTTSATSGTLDAPVVARRFLEVVAELRQISSLPS